MAYQSPFMRGRSTAGGTRGAIGEFARKLHQDRIHGRVKITARQEKELVDTATEEFVKNGKDPYKIREKDFEKHVLNRLRMDKNDLLETEDVNKLSQRYGIEHRTDKVDMSDIDD